MSRTPLPPLAVSFSAERFAALGEMSALIAPPYDVITAGRRAALAARHEHNIVRLILPQDAGDRYQAAGALLGRWRRDGVLVSEEGPGVYVLQQRFVAPDGNALVRTGVLAAVVAEPYAEGRILPHERTHDAPKADRLSLMRATGAMFEALLMVAPDPRREMVGLLQGICGRQSLVRAELDGVGIEMWRVGEPEAGAVLSRLDPGRLYIADGHHRYETAVAYRRETGATRTLGLIVPRGDPGLITLPTHRVLAGGQIDSTECKSLLQNDFDMKPVAPDRALSTLDELRGHAVGCLVVLPGEDPLRLELRPGIDRSKADIAGEPAVRALDISWIDPLVVHPLRRLIGDIAQTAYSPNAADVLGKVAGGTVAAGVLVNPTPLDGVLSVADAGSVMPPKSTYFQPKVPSGMVVLPL